MKMAPSIAITVGKTEVLRLSPNKISAFRRHLLESPETKAAVMDAWLAHRNNTQASRLMAAIHSCDQTLVALKVRGEEVRKEVDAAEQAYNSASHDLQVLNARLEQLDKVFASRREALIKLTNGDLKAIQKKATLLSGDLEETKRIIAEAKIPAESEATVVGIINEQAEEARRIMLDLVSRQPASVGGAGLDTAMVIGRAGKDVNREVEAITNAMYLDLGLGKTAGEYTLLADRCVEIAKCLEFHTSETNLAIRLEEQKMATGWLFDPPASPATAFDMVEGVMLDDVRRAIAQIRKESPFDAKAAEVNGILESIAKGKKELSKAGKIAKELLSKGIGSFVHGMIGSPDDVGSLEAFSIADRNARSLMFLLHEIDSWEKKYLRAVAEYLDATIDIRRHGKKVKDREANVGAKVDELSSKQGSCAFVKHQIGKVLPKRQILQDELDRLEGLEWHEASRKRAHLERSPKAERRAVEPESPKYTPIPRAKAGQAPSFDSGAERRKRVAAFVDDAYASIGDTAKKYLHIERDIRETLQIIAQVYIDSGFKLTRLALTQEFGKGVQQELSNKGDRADFNIVRLNVRGKQFRLMIEVGKSNHFGTPIDHQAQPIIYGVFNHQESEFFLDKGSYRNARASAVANKGALQIFDTLREWGSRQGGATKTNGKS